MRYRILVRTLLIFLIAIAAQQTWAAEKISWENLMPPIDSLLNPLANLSSEQKMDFEDVFWTENLKQQGRPASRSIEEQTAESRKRLQDQGLDVDQLIKKTIEYQDLIIRQQSVTVPSLNGKTVQLPGYVLPLESEGNKVTEFLLVPYVGACIHTPPPPANQIVHVRSLEGIEIDGLFTAVWVTGQISIEKKLQSIDLSDGQSKFEVGYALQAIAVEPIEQ